MSSAQTFKPTVYIASNCRKTKLKKLSSKCVSKKDTTIFHGQRRRKFGIKPRYSAKNPSVRSVLKENGENYTIKNKQWTTWPLLKVNKIMQDWTTLWCPHSWCCQRYWNDIVEHESGENNNAEHTILLTTMNNVGSSVLF